MAQMTKQRVLGVVENMAYFVCPDCGGRHYIFGRGAPSRSPGLMDTRLLGRIPLDEATREGGDNGLPAALDPSSPVGAAFSDIARALDADGDGSGAPTPGADAAETTTSSRSADY